MSKPQEFQQTPQVPNFDKEAKEAVEYEGLPPLFPRKHTGSDVLFINVNNIFTSSGGNVHSRALDERGSVLVSDGRVVCSGDCLTSRTTETAIVDLKGGSISPGLVSFGSPLGLQEIEAEDSTNDGDVLDPLTDSIPKILRGGESIISAVDGLQFAGRSALYVQT